MINRVRGDLILNYDMMDPDDISELLKIKTVGVIPDEDSVSVFSSTGAPLKSSSAAAKAFDLLAKNLHSREGEIFDCTQRYRGVFGKIRRSLRKRV